MTNYFITVRKQFLASFETLSVSADHYAVSEYGDLNLYNSETETMTTFAREFWVAITSEPTTPFADELNPKVNFGGLVLEAQDD